MVTLHDTCNAISHDKRFVLYTSTFRSQYAEPNVAVSSSLLLCFPAKLLRYFLNDSEMVPLSPVIKGITFVFIFLPLFFFRTDFIF